MAPATQNQTPLPPAPTDGGTATAPSDSATATATPPADPIQPTSRRQKEMAPATPTAAPETSTGNSETATPVVEVPGAGPVEVEPAKELEPEIEKLVDKIREHKIKSPQTTVISADETPQSVPKTVAQPVVVLPLSEEGMKQGRRKNTRNSIRWLYEWCTRQIDKLREFMVVYRED